MIHGDKYDYSKTFYKGSREKVCIICHDKDRKGNEIGEFWQMPLDHLKGYGCKREKKGIKDEAWETRVCPICGKEFKERKKYERITCSPECRAIYVEIHKEEINKKRSESLKKTFSNKSKEEIRLAIEKARKTSMERYGKPNFAQTEEGRKISSEVMKKFKKEWDKKYTKDVLIPKYMQICENDNLELLEFRNRFDCTVRCKKCGNIFVVKTLGYLSKDDITDRCRICHPIVNITGPTKMEDEMSEFLDAIGVKYYRNYRGLIPPLEVDFYLPEYNIAIEMDGLYWHSEVNKPNPNYHKEKTEKCLSNGIRLIHIFEDEWYNKKKICQSIILNALNKDAIHIGARQCKVKELKPKDYRNFLNENHIQGYTASKYGLGLFYNDELVMVMTFGGLRRNLGYKKQDVDFYEIVRLCSKIGYSITGGVSKLLKAFIRQYNPYRIITYADRRWSEGKVYEKLGFEFDHNTEPNYFYVVGRERKNRFCFRKSELMRKYGCPPEKTEKEFCMENKWYRIYDCGSKYFELNLLK